MKIIYLTALSLYLTVLTQCDEPGRTTRYWDCCRVSCTWPAKGPFVNEKWVDSCQKDGKTFLADKWEQSGCTTGNAFACSNNQPWAVNDSLSYGFAAANLGSAKGEPSWCCACYEMTFTSGPVNGKKMIVQVTNTGGDLGVNHFDMQIPGGGVGIFGSGCQKQWNAPADGWGKRYGGVSSKSECAQLPADLQPGCNWRFDWFKGADNPEITFKRVKCPTELTQRTNCVRTDESSVY